MGLNFFKKLFDKKKYEDDYYNESQEIKTENFPMLPLRDLVLFPDTVISIFLKVQSDIAALDEARSRDNRMFAVCLKKTETGYFSSEPYETGTVVRIINRLKLPDNTYRVVLQCEYRGIILQSSSQRFVQNDDVTDVKVEPLKLTGLSDPLTPDDLALLRSVQKSFVRYSELSKRISSDTLSAVEKTENPERMANLICNSAYLKTERKLELLRHTDTRKRLLDILETLEKENEIYSIQKSITGKVRHKMDKRHREYVLNEQLREINKELGKDKHEDEYAALEERINEKNPPPEVKEKAAKELKRLKKLQPLSPEAAVLRGYLEWIADLPWSAYTTDSGNLNDAQKILDEDHFGMKKAKDRIVEFIAVRQLLSSEQSEEQEEQGSGAAIATQAIRGQGSEIDASNPSDLITSNDNEQQYRSPIPDPRSQDSRTQSTEFTSLKKTAAPSSIKGPILCFVGPPGTGKTSLGKSVARALGREFTRISLGGVRDEAVIRGHRKTYVGSLPGRIIQSMRKAGTINPVFLLDEIDKLSGDFRGDPASALLEVLDPEQNQGFVDHYLEVQYDLSKVMFITTANSLHSIPYPLLDRMEIIEVPGYGENEKLTITKQFLIPKQLKENGLANAKIKFTDEAIKSLIRHWTMESGVRSLERETARCIRRIARNAVNEGYASGNGELSTNPEGEVSRVTKPISGFKKTVTPSVIEKLLGKKKHKRDVVYKEARIGVTYGLAYTDYGGSLLPVETIRYEGHGELLITGNLGDVMKESARIALSYLRSVASHYKFSLKDISKSDFHIHVPEGAIPKDGPSGGITLASSLLSTLCKAPPKPCVAMTGELTLTGRVLPIGGLKEKLLAAIRCGMETVLLPAENEADWYELDKDIKDSVKVEFVETASEVFDKLFGKSILKSKS